MLNLPKLFRGEFLDFSVIGLLIGIDFADILARGCGPTQPLLHATWAIVAIQFLGSHLGFGFGEYWTHFALHRVPVLWVFHRPHHSAERLNFFTVGRAHPMEYVVLGAGRVIGMAVGTGLVLYLTGTTLIRQTLATQAFVQTVLGAIAVFQHMHIPISFGPLLNVLIGGPVLHQIHHSAEIRHRDKNFGGQPIFDWVFGTLYLPRRAEIYQIGRAHV